VCASRVYTKNVASLVQPRQGNITPLPAAIWGCGDATRITSHARVARARILTSDIGRSFSSDSRPDGSLSVKEYTTSCFSSSEALCGVRRLSLLNTTTRHLAAHRQCRVFHTQTNTFSGDSTSYRIARYMEARHRHSIYDNTAILPPAACKSTTQILNTMSSSTYILYQSCHPVEYNSFVTCLEDIFLQLSRSVLNEITSSLLIPEGTVQYCNQ
jgi:hypothetical protein